MSRLDLVFIALKKKRSLVLKKDYYVYMDRQEKWIKQDPSIYYKYLLLDREIIEKEKDMACPKWSI